jgi:hypothetical protein
MFTYHAQTLREALLLAVSQASTTGRTRQIGHCGDPYGWTGYAVIDHEGTAYPGSAAPASWCWVADVQPDGSVDHHPGHFSRWDAEISRARNQVARMRDAIAKVQRAA